MDQSLSQMEENLKKIATDYNASEGVSADGNQLDLFSNAEIGPIAKVSGSILLRLYHFFLYLLL